MDTYRNIPDSGGGSTTVLLSNIEPIQNNTILGNTTGGTHYPVELTS